MIRVYKCRLVYLLHLNFRQKKFVLSESGDSYMNTAYVIKKNTKIITENNQEKYIVRKLGNIERKPVYSAIKRAFDIVVSFTAIVFLLIPMIIISLVIIMDSSGGAVYTQERLGKNGKEFVLYKFRTMKADAEKNGAQWALEDDERCTRVGKFLRATRLDELMQLFNILKGDMSFVGPRPERGIFYKEFSHYIDGFEQRLYVTPGLTGLAQINGGYDLKPEEKIAYDLEYIENRNFFSDLKIIFSTVAIIFNHNGAR